MFQRSDSINELATALSKAQAMMKSAAKDATNPHFKSRYANLASVVDALREPLSVNGLSLSQIPSADGPKVTIASLLMHSSGQWLSGDLTLMAQQATPQAVGSAITYGRRYSAMSITGLAPDDDDGEEAEGRGQRPPQARKPQVYKASPSSPREDIPFEGPPSYVGEPEIERYSAKDHQKRELMKHAKKHGIEAKEELLDLSIVCADRGGVEMEHLEAAVREFVSDRRKK